jgi:3-oxoacyl-[acyl-carrier protein] reductase
MDLGLHDRACIVTGASKGIGLAVSRLLVDEGARVLMVSRGPEALRAAAEGLGERASWLAADVGRPDAAAEIVGACAARFGSVDALVNNAGFADMKDLNDLTDAEWQRDWDVHVMAAMRLMREACPRMAARGWGRVVNVSSSSGKRPSGSLAMSYSVTKSAQLSLSRAFADRFAADGVRVNAIAPGMTLSEGWTGEGELGDKLAAKLGVSREEALRTQGGRSPIGRPLEVDEIARIVVVLCSELASGVAGAAWSVDGGTWASIV